MFSVSCVRFDLVRFAISRSDFKVRVAGNPICDLRFAIYVYKKKETPGSEDPGEPLGEQIRRESSTSASLPL